MERLIDSKSVECIMLTTQYRMHAQLREWPSLMFYSNLLTDHISISNRDLLHMPQLLPSNHVRVLVVCAQREGERKGARKEGTSWKCESEARVAVDLVNQMQNTMEVDASVGVIALYSAQQRYIEQEMKNNKNNCVISSVDGFQGGECDVIVLSLVRLSSFASDAKRLNVALTRAKKYLIVLISKEEKEKNKDNSSLVSQLLQSFEDSQIVEM